MGSIRGTTSDDSALYRATTRVMRSPMASELCDALLVCSEVSGDSEGSKRRCLVGNGQSTPQTRIFVNTPGDCVEDGVSLD
jgi:hypothetical protein